MPYVITAACIDITDKSCIEECPVDCIYEGDRKLYINPGECIDCGACEPVCPVEAISQDRRVPLGQEEFVADNARFFARAAARPRGPARQRGRLGRRRRDRRGHRTGVRLGERLMPAPTIGVVGAGTMGAGIAQVAAVAGDQVLLADAIPGAAERAIGRIRDQVRAQAARGRIDADADALSLRAADLADLGGCDVVVEAVAEDLPAKRSLFADLERVVGDGCLLASNSSSFSPTAMAASLARPERLVGLHFFNPVRAMRLAEVISGLATAPETADRAAALARAWGKTVVRSAATPGFIVNRIARPFTPRPGGCWRRTLRRLKSSTPC